jgi:hypothetical protein
VSHIGHRSQPPAHVQVMACTWGLCIADHRLALRGLRNIGAGCLLCLLSGAAIACMCSVHPDAQGIQANVSSGDGIYFGISSL